jgi:transcriptional regulator with XRE-family HTH domain
MTPADLRATAKALGLSGRGLAAALGYNERTYRRWLAGGPMPKSLPLACEALLARQASSLPQVQPVVSL